MTEITSEEVNDLKIISGTDDDVLIRVIFLLSNSILQQCVIDIITNVDDIQKYTLGEIK